jgi:hypothetical protein
MKVIKLLLNAPKVLLIFLLLATFFVLEGFLMIIYVIFETPLSFTLGWLERTMRRLLKHVQ